MDSAWQGGNSSPASPSSQIAPLNLPQVGVFAGSGIYGTYPSNLSRAVVIHQHRPSGWVLARRRTKARAGKAIPEHCPRTAGRGPAAAGRRRGYRDVFAVAEFRALWAAQVLSVGGDQLARVALTVLVYAHTGSALLAAVAYAASIAPQFLGGLLLSGLADRWPRRSVMIVCDLARAPLAALMAVPGMPTGALIGLCARSPRWGRRSRRLAPPLSPKSSVTPFRWARRSR